LPGKGYWRKCTPAVSRYWLFLLAGVIWSGVGIGLCLAACVWFSEMHWPENGILALLGFLLGTAVYRFGFSKIAGKNSSRIAERPGEVCLFAFQPWRSYLLIVMMMLLGYVLRHSNLPRPIVALIYMTIGTGLTFSSSLYYLRFLEG
jgi:hypothetical protein